MLRADFCCNNPENGNFTGRATAIHLPGINFEHDHVLGVRLSVNRAKMTLRLGGPWKGATAGRWFTFDGWHQWFGNWCWDAYWLRSAEMISLVRYLMAHPDWRPEGYAVDLMERFQASQALPEAQRLKAEQELASMMGELQVRA